MRFAFGARSRTCSYMRPGWPSSGPWTVWQNGVSIVPPSASPSMPGWAWAVADPVGLREGGAERRVDRAPEREPEHARVVVDDVELVRLAEGVDRVLHLPVRVADPLA